MDNDSYSIAVPKGGKKLGDEYVRYYVPYEVYIYIRQLELTSARLEWEDYERRLQLDSEHRL